jgi:hypothetical protein
LTMDSSQGRRILRLFLEQRGNTLTGTIEGGFAGESRLRGNVDGDSLYFTTESDVRGRMVRSEYTGNIIGSRLHGTMTVRTIGGGFEIPRRPGGRRRDGRMPSDTRFADWSARRVEP